MNSSVKEEMAKLGLDEENVGEFIGKDEMERFNKVLNTKNILSIEDLCKEIKEEDSLYIFEQKDFINENLLNTKSKQKIIIEKAKDKENTETYFSSFDSFLFSKFKNVENLKEKFDKYNKEEFIIRYQNDFIDRKFKFAELWNNYNKYNEKITLEGKNHKWISKMKWSIRNSNSKY